MSQLALRDEWYTPDEAFKDLEAKYGPFEIDVAASALNTKCPLFYTAEDDALTKPWHGVVWCNPPYRNIKAWVYHAWKQVDNGTAKRVVMLLPSHTATEWFHFALEHGRVEFIKGKLKFGGASGVPFTGSVVVIFGGAA
jgi:phage N-6-adenine-methyltransferase